MRLRLFRAADLRGAMALAREQLGPDALILATRRVAEGIELTAALEAGGLPPALAPLPLPPDLARATMLGWHGVPAPLADRLSCTGTSMAASLAEHLVFGAIDLSPGSAPVLLTGPPGAGKTLTAARLATRLVMAGGAPIVITADGTRAGATDQLAAFTRLLGLTLIVANHPATLARALARRSELEQQPGAPVLIDAPGIDVFDPAQRDELIGLASTGQAQMAMVMPAGLDVAEAQEQAAAFVDAGATLMVATRLDLARRLGSVLAAASTSGLRLAEAGISPGAADGLVVLTPELLAARLAARARAEGAFHIAREFSMDAA